MVLRAGGRIPVSQTDGHTSGMIRARFGPAAALALAATLLAGCSEDEPAPDPDRIVLNPATDGAGHTHGPGETDALPVGDGTTAAAGGYRIAEVRLVGGADAPGDLSFRILDSDDRPVTDLVEVQTKAMHLYVVRTDLAVYRHVHPVLVGDRWQTRVDLGEPGEYRVIADFQPAAADRPVVVGEDAVVPGRWRPAAPATSDDAAAGDDGMIRVTVDGPVPAGPDGRLRIVVTTLDGGPVTLGSYLGTTAHVSGLRMSRRAADRRFVHVHPFGAPEVSDDGTRLVFHTEFGDPGSYRLFVQVRVDGLLHTVPVTATVLAADG